MTTAAQPLAGTYAADPVHSSFGFAIRYSGLTDYRGELSGVTAGLRTGEDGLVLEGAAKVESISIQNPPQFRAHVLGPEFFDNDNHPEVGFRSTRVELSEDGKAVVEGELTIRGVSRPVVASGTWSQAGPAAAFELETTFDRRDFGIDWQMELPGQGDALAYDVTLDVNLVLKPVETDES